MNPLRHSPAAVQSAQDGKVYTGLEPSSSRVNSALTPPPGLMDCRPMLPMSRDNWSEGIIPDTCIGRSSLYGQEKFRSDPFNNPFLQVDTMNCPEVPQRILTSGKRKLGLTERSSSSERSLFEGTPSKIGIKFGTLPDKEDWWISRPKFE